MARTISGLAAVVLTGCADFTEGEPAEPPAPEEEEDRYQGHGATTPSPPTREHSRPGMFRDFPAWEAPPYVAVAAEGSGHAVFREAADGLFRRVEARLGAVPEVLSSALGRLSPGTDSKVAMSRDGRWLALETTRFGCTATPCLAVVAGDLSSGERVTVGRAPVRVGGGTLAVGAEGRLVVYGAWSRGHDEDLFSVVRTPRGWSESRNLSETSPFAFNHHPSLSPDSRRVVFDCGYERIGAARTAICDSAVDGTGFHVLRRPQDTDNLRNPSYAPDGTIVFERDSGPNGSELWRMSPDGTDAAIVNPAASLDRAPCVLPSGSILSLFTMRAGNAQRFRELKLMSAEASVVGFLHTDADIADEAISCGN